MSASPARRLAVSLAVLCAAGGAAAADLALPPSPAARAAEAEFQRVTGGFGTGPGLDFAGCGASLDVRVEDVCEDVAGPVPGCGSLCPDHGYHDRIIR